MASEPGAEKFAPIFGRAMEGIAGFFSDVALRQRGVDPDSRAGKLLGNIAGAIGDFVQTFGMSKVRTFFNPGIEWVRFVVDQGDQFEKGEWETNDQGVPIRPTLDDGSAKETTAEFARRVMG